MIEQTIEELVDSYLKAKSLMDDAEAQKAVMQQAILDKLKELKLSGLKTKTGYNVKRVVSQLYSGVNLAVARELGATKTEEKVDTNKLKAIAANGIKIEGTKTIVYVKVEEAK